MVIKYFWLKLGWIIVTDNTVYWKHPHFLSQTCWRCFCSWPAIDLQCPPGPQSGLEKQMHLCHCRLQSLCKLSLCIWSLLNRITWLISFYTTLNWKSRNRFLKINISAYTYKAAAQRLLLRRQAAPLQPRYRLHLCPASARKETNTSPLLMSSSELPDQGNVMLKSLYDLMRTRRSDW